MSHDCMWLTYKEWSDLHCQVMRGQRASVDEKETDFRKQKKFCKCQVVQVIRRPGDARNSGRANKAHAAEGSHTQAEQREPQARADESPSVQQMPLESVPMRDERRYGAWN